MKVYTYHESTLTDGLALCYVIAPQSQMLHVAWPREMFVTSGERGATHAVEAGHTCELV